MLIAAANQSVNVPGLPLPNTQFPRGIINLPGLVIQGVPASDTSLRDASTLIAWIGSGPTTGDVTGNIEVGQVLALDVPHNIAGDVTARANDLDTVEFGYAIKRIRAGNKISGNIIAGDANPAVAADPDDGSTLGTRESSIDTIIVGPSLTSEGITGHIIARRGKIDSILTTGKLGTSTSVRSKVEAGHGLGRIRAIDESGSELVTNTNVGNDFFADVKNALAPSAGTVPVDLLDLIDTNGNFAGSVHVRNMYGESGQFRDAANHAGILVRGYIDADITVDHLMVYANIIGSSIRKPIVIGKQLKGAIVAYARPGLSSDPVAGTMHSVTVGYIPVADDVFTDFARGMVGIANPPIDLTPRGDLSDATLFPPDPNDPPASPVLSDPDRWFWRYGGDATAMDSVIRAEVSIGTVQLASMTPRFIGSGTKAARPRIESPSIDILRIGIDAEGNTWGEMKYGVVWSGKLDYEYSGGSYSLVDNIHNDYALVKHATITCVSPWSDLWFQMAEDPENPTALRRFDIKGDLLGEVHVPSFGGRDLLWIGGKVGDWSNTCGCLGETEDPGTAGSEGQPAECVNPAFTYNEDSPRGNWPAVDPFDPLAGRAPRGAVYCLNTADWNGQLILNGDGVTSPDPADFWRGIVRIGGDPSQPPPTPLPIDFAIDQSQPTLAPEYNALSAATGK